jgi:hypothetical protein
VSKNWLHSLRVVVIGGRASICFGSAFGDAAVFAPTLAMFSSQKISNDFSTKIYVKLEAPNNSRLQNREELRDASAPAVKRGRHIAVKFGRKIVADFRLENFELRKSWGENRRATKRGPVHIVARPPIATTRTPCSLFFDPVRVPPLDEVWRPRRTSLFCLPIPLENKLVWSHQSFRP